jgi:hypothetical protein
MAKIADIEGIGPAHRDQLVAAGINTTDALLERAAKSNGPRDLAAITGIQESVLLEWVNRADLRE